jgi:defect-in-organelle-trafficking protein DotD
MKKFVILVCCLLLNACNTTQVPQLPAKAEPIPVSSASDEASIKLAEAATAVSQSLTQLAAVNQANMAPQAAKLYPKVAQMQIPGTSSVDWNGPIQPLLKQIANAVGYRLIVSGNAPAIPIIVLIRAQERGNAEIVQDAALQAESRATVTSDFRLKTIHLTYHGM